MKVGDKVTYVPEVGPKECGIVKKITDQYVFVVYKCDGEWDRYYDYTGAATPPERLVPGWKEDES
jgi:hypothetical protein